jgi:hypothetical protein
MLLTVKYSCDKCGIVKRDVIVAERQLDQDVAEYVEYVGGCCVEDHGRRSPHCQVQTLTGVMIPINDTLGIGFKP